MQNMYFYIDYSQSADKNLIGINAESNFVNLLSLDFCSQGQVFVQNNWQISSNNFKFLSMLLQFISLRK
jgi:hypothetical protein